jgi:hypothetical protein
MMKNMMRIPRVALLVGLFLLILGGTTYGEELLIIANPDLASPRLDTKGLQRIYMGKQTRWVNDEAIVPVMLKAGPVHEAFVEAFLDRSPHRFATYWRQMIFTGKGTPPRSFDNEEDLIAFVAATPGSVGYASATTDVNEVKVLTVVQD